MVEKTRRSHEEKQLSQYCAYHNNMCNEQFHLGMKRNSEEKQLSQYVQFTSHVN